MMRILEEGAEQIGALSSGPEKKPHDEPHETRAGFGWLRNGNTPGDFRRAPRCLATNRAGKPCMAPALKGRKRCRLHGGWSAGPRSPEGLARSRAARLEHGFFSRETAQVRREVRVQVQSVRAALAAAEARLLAMPPVTDSASLRARYDADRAVADELRALFDSVTALLLSKLGSPSDGSSETSLVSVMRDAQWARLCPAFNELGIAMVRGPGRTRFLGAFHSPRFPPSPVSDAPSLSGTYLHFNVR